MKKRIKDVNEGLFFLVHLFIGYCLFVICNL
jgi:hypothetical protein